MKIALFDVDDTLVSVQGPIWLRFEQALVQVHKVEPKTRVANSQGLTDKQLLQRFAELNGVTDCRFDECFRVMIKEFEKNLDLYEFIIKPGVKRLLEVLAKSLVLIGHLTGNARRIAELKMMQIGIDGYFTFGGYGDLPHQSRHELAALAVQEAIQKFGLVAKRHQVYVIGDTPKDVVCGKQAKVATIAVATGKYSTQQLMRKKPDLLIEDFETGLDEVLEFMELAV